MAQPYVGEIRMFAGNFAPAGWMFCSGQSLPISEYETLFQLIGTTYGGDGQSTFDLPNLQSRIPIHQGTGPDGPTYQLAEMAGTQQIPAHTHPLTGSSDAAGSQVPDNSVLATSTATVYYNLPDNLGAMSANSIGQAGGSQPHENTQPFLCVNYIISLFGIFPSAT